MFLSDLIDGTKKVDSDRVSNYVTKGIYLINDEKTDDTRQLDFKIISETGKQSYKATMFFNLESDKKSLVESDVKVNCDCMDHRFTFSYHNFKNDCHFGVAPEAYQRKTDRPSKNPKNYIGMCKHLLGAFHFAKSKNIFKYS